MVAVGHRFGFPGDAPLKHVARDATRVRDVFVALGGVRPEHATVLLEPNRAALFATIDKLAALASGRRREDVSVLFYFSGPGIARLSTSASGASRCAISIFPSELSLGYAARTGRLYDVGHELSFRYEYASNAFAIGLGAMGGVGSMDRTTREATVSSLGAEAIAEVRSRLGDVTLRAGAGPRVVALVQPLRRTDAARLALAGYESEQRFRGATLGGHVLLGARLALGSRTWVDLDARGELSALRMQGSLAATWTAGIGTAVGMSF